MLDRLSPSFHKALFLIGVLGQIVLAYATFTIGSAIGRYFGFTSVASGIGFTCLLMTLALTPVLVIASAREGHTTFRKVLRRIPFRNFSQRKREAERQAYLAKVRAIEISRIDLMEGVQFEHYVGEVLIFQGYSVRHVGRSGDQGVDLIAERTTTKYAVQAKRYNSTVSNSAIQEVVAGKAIHGCNAAMVITNSEFTKGAQELARANGCQLVDRTLFLLWVMDFQSAGMNWQSILEE